MRKHLYYACLRNHITVEGQDPDGSRCPKRSKLMICLLNQHIILFIGCSSCDLYSPDNSCLVFDILICAFITKVYMGHFQMLEISVTD